VIRKRDWDREEYAGLDQLDYVGELYLFCCNFFYRECMSACLCENAAGVRAFARPYLFVTIKL
jgi:hypothetical protein